MGSNRSWTKKEEELLARLYGSRPLDFIAKKLGRTVWAIINKRARLKLGAFLGNGDYITLNQLHKAVTGSNGGGGYIMTSWVRNRRLPVMEKKVGKCSFRVVRLTDFWKWAEANRAFLDFSKMEENILGIEPDWVKTARRADAKTNTIKRMTPWTRIEDARLTAYIKEGQKTGKEIASLLGRTEGAVARRCKDLGLSNPKRSDPHSHSWNEEEMGIAVQSVLQAIPYPLISQRIGISEKAIRGVMYRLYKTENQDKIRAIIKKRGGTRHEVSDRV